LKELIWSNEQITQFSFDVYDTLIQDILRTREEEKQNCGEMPERRVGA